MKRPLEAVSVATQRMLDPCRGEDPSAVGTTPSVVCRSEPSQKMQRSKTSKTVRFSEEENTLHKSPFDETEVDQTWMTDKDYREIKQDVRATLWTILRASGDATKLDASECCLRGLEGLLEMMMLRTARRDIRKHGIQLVVLSQKSLPASACPGVRDILGEDYGELSRRSTRRALELAYVDSLT